MSQSLSYFSKWKTTPDFYEQTRGRLKLLFVKLLPLRAASPQPPHHHNHLSTAREELKRASGVLLSVMLSLDRLLTPTTSLPRLPTATNKWRETSALASASGSTRQAQCSAGDLCLCLRRRTIDNLRCVIFFSLPHVSVARGWLSLLSIFNYFVQGGDVGWFSRFGFRLVTPVLSPAPLYSWKKCLDELRSKVFDTGNFLCSGTCFFIGEYCWENNLCPKADLFPFLYN